MAILPGHKVSLMSGTMWYGLNTASGARPSALMVSRAHSAHLVWSSKSCIPWVGEGAIYTSVPKTSIFVPHMGDHFTHAPLVKTDMSVGLIYMSPGSGVWTAVPGESVVPLNI